MPKRCCCSDVCDDPFCGFNMSDHTNAEFQINLSGYSSSGSCIGTTGYAVVNGTHTLTFDGTHTGYCDGEIGPRYRVIIADGAAWQAVLSLRLNYQPLTTALCLVSVNYGRTGLGSTQVTHNVDADTLAEVSTVYTANCTVSNTTTGSVNSVTQTV